ncbi:hypothetical protein TNCV_825221 [Trichonephila clavipes]|nr:hypothetical protein TNCV_825221 [Trichonephila clavipes]
MVVSSSGKEVGLLPVMNSNLEWKADNFFCSILRSSFVTNVYNLLFVLYVSVLPLALHMYPRIKTHDNNNENESQLDVRNSMNCAKKWPRRYCTADINGRRVAGCPQTNLVW